MLVMKWLPRCVSGRYRMTGSNSEHRLGGCKFPFVIVVHWPRRGSASLAQPPDLLRRLRGTGHDAAVLYKKERQ